MRVHFTTGFALVAASALIGVTGIGVAVAAGGRPLSTDLNGAQEVPGPGDDNASGHASITLNQGEHEVCFDLDWSEINGTVVAAHIHRAPAGFAGPVVVPLFSSLLGGTGGTSGCAEADADLIKAIRKDPSAYYVNVHSTDFSAGAVRGQLGD